MKHLIKAIFAFVLFQAASVFAVGEPFTQSNFDIKHLQ